MTLQEHFESMLRACYGDRPILHVQRDEMERAFYGGAASCFFELFSGNTREIAAELQRFKRISRQRSDELN